LGILFDLQTEGEPHLLPINIELNFYSSHINVCIGHTQERPLKNERGLGVVFLVKDGEINRVKKLCIFTGIFSIILAG